MCNIFPTDYLKNNKIDELKDLRELKKLKDEIEEKNNIKKDKIDGLYHNIEVKVMTNEWEIPIIKDKIDITERKTTRLTNLLKGVLDAQNRIEELEALSAPSSIMEPKDKLVLQGEYLMKNS